MARRYGKDSGTLFRYLSGLPIIALSTSLLIGIFYLVTQFKFQPPCANSLSCKESLTLKVENGAAGVFNGKKVAAPSIDLSQKEVKTKVLAEETATGEKHVYVDLTHQTLTAYQGNTVFMQTLISSGKWFPTPTGDFTVWMKIRATRMTGGQGADFYDLPNVPYVMFFSGSGISEGRGFSLHGTYWHNNFGHPMSHGCVNMRISDAQKLYDWINPPTNGFTTRADDNNPGTKITIYGQAPL